MEMEYFMNLSTKVRTQYVGSIYTPTYTKRETVGTWKSIDLLDGGRLPLRNALQILYCIIKYYTDIM